MSILAILKIIHILAGFSTLISGFFAIFTRKGKHNHRLTGRIFFWSMTITTLLGLNAGIFKPEFRIFVPIALISFYQVATGYRILFIKKLHKNQNPELVDWVLTGGMLLTSMVFIFLGIVNLEKDAMFSIVVFSFSTIGLYCCGVDLYNYILRPKNELYWLFVHIFRMSHAFIAAITAFLVNNSKIFPYIPTLLLLIIPISLGQPIITWVIFRYKQNMNKARQMVENAQQ